MGQAAATSAGDPVIGNTIALVVCGGVSVGTDIHIFLQLL